MGEWRVYGHPLVCAEARVRSRPRRSLLPVIKRPPNGLLACFPRCWSHLHFVIVMLYERDHAGSIKFVPNLPQDTPRALFVGTARIVPGEQLFQTGPRS